MDLILLPGNSVSNRDWIESLSQSLQPHFDSTVIQYYRHWQIGGGFNPSHEREQLKHLVNKLTPAKHSPPARGGVAKLQPGGGGRSDSPPARGGVAKLQPGGGGGSYAILAKSVGVHLTIDSFSHRIVAPQACIFLGTTSRSAESIANWPIPTLFIQEINDPLLSFDRLKSILDDFHLAHSQVQEIPGNNHRYSDISTITQLINQFIDVYEAQSPSP